MKLTITWELPDGTSAEAAAALAQRWAAGQIGGDGRLPRPASIKVTGTEQPAEQLPDDHQARRLAERRRALGLSQRALARRINMTHSVISDVERGRRGPNSRAARLVRQALDIAEAAR